MSQQQSLNAFFSVRKHATDEHAAKRRKVVLDEGTSAVVKAKTTPVVPKAAGSKKLEGGMRTRELAKVIVKTRPKVSDQDDFSSSSSTDGTSKKDIASQEVIGTVVTSFLDDHGVGQEAAAASPVVATPKSVRADPVNRRHRKRDAPDRDDGVSQEQKAEQQVLFTIGKPSTVRKRLDLAKTDGKQEKKVVSFHKMSHLSPQKKDSAPQSPVKNVSFEKLGALSPAKQIPDPKDLANLKAKAGKLLLGGADAKLTPQEVKNRLGTVTKLSDLQAKLKSINSGPIASLKTTTHKRALFTEPGPKLSKESLTLEIVKEKSVKPPPSPVKASPRKSVVEGPIAANLVQPDSRLPLPKKYNFLAQVFGHLDQIVCMRHNQGSIIRVEDIKPALQNVLRRTVNDDFLKQIRCVFPNAYVYTWERVRDRMNRETNNYELHMQVNLEFNKKKDDENNGEKRVHQKFTPGLQSERLRVFKHNLLTIVQDHHDVFLRQNGFPICTAFVAAWHPDFDCDSLPDVDMVDFPTKPFVEKVTTAQGMIQRLGLGLNPRLESVLKQRAEVAEAKPEVAQAENKTVGEIKILKGLQGLSPKLLEMLKAKEMAKQLKTMTQSSQEQKEIELMEELVEHAPAIVNCHKAQKNGAAVTSEALFKVAADSNGRKTPKEMEELVRLFVRLMPECMLFKTYEKVEYVLLKKPWLDNNQIRSKLEKLVAEKKNTP